MRFQIGDGKIYDAQDIESLSLKQLLLLEQQTTVLGRPLRMAEIRHMSEELQACKTDAERSNHPSAPWLLAVTLWATRTMAGEALSFDEAIDFPLSQLRFVPEPQDRKAPVNPRKARPVSGRAANRAPSPTSKRISK